MKTLILSAFILFSMVFNLNAQDNPCPCAGISMSKSELLKNKELLVSNNYTIKEFTVSGLVEKGYEKVVRNKSAKFTPDVIDLIKRVKPGNKIYFEEIIAVNNKGEKFKITPFFIVIRE